MKKILLSMAVVAGIGVGAIFISLPFAQAQDSGSVASVTETSPSFLEALAGIALKLDRLLEVLVARWETPTVEPVSPEDFAAAASASSFQGRYQGRCFPSDMPYSNTFKDDGGWSLGFVAEGVDAWAINSNYQPMLPHMYRVTDQFIDVNGDGLPDYLYAKSNFERLLSFNLFEACLILNNGSGWDTEPAYSCRAYYDPTWGPYHRAGNPHASYWGDCADTSGQ